VIWNSLCGSLFELSIKRGNYSLKRYFFFSLRGPLLCQAKEVFKTLALLLDLTHIPPLLINLPQLALRLLAVTAPNAETANIGLCQVGLSAIYLRVSEISPIESSTIAIATRRCDTFTRCVKHAGRKLSFFPR
jgi:hypothetical protein